MVMMLCFGIHISIIFFLKYIVSDGGGGGFCYFLKYLS